MLGRRKINCKRKLAPNSHETKIQVSPCNWCRVPCIQKKKNGFQSHPNGIMFIADDSKTFVKIMVDVLNKHAVMILGREQMSVEL